MITLTIYIKQTSNEVSVAADCIANNATKDELATEAAITNCIQKFAESFLAKVGNGIIISGPGADAQVREQIKRMKSE